MKEAQAYLEKLLKPNDSVVVAVSGGPDSMALLHLLIVLKGILNIKIVCAHVNHNVRQESEIEKEMVEAFCKKNEVIFEYMKINETISGNFENGSRKIRYAFFEELINKYEAKYLFTAHHGDDLIETILMRIVRGSNLAGYSGFKKETNLEKYKIVRPFITTTKEEIEAYLRENHVRYATDASNFSETYTRNRYRKYMLPFLKTEEENVHKKFLKFSETIEEYDNYINKETNRIISQIYSKKRLDIKEFKKQDKLIQKNILYYILKEESDIVEEMNDRHLEMLERLINSRKANTFIFIPGKKIIKEYNYIVFEEENKTEEYMFELEDYIVLPNTKIIEKIKESSLDSNYICRLDSKEVKLPLFVRSRKNGDKMSIKGMLGTKKIKDIFIDEKVPSEKRDKWPIVTDSVGNILWLPGLKKSHFNKDKKEFCDIILKYY